MNDDDLMLPSMRGPAPRTEPAAQPPSNDLVLPSEVSGQSGPGLTDKKKFEGGWSDVPGAAASNLIPSAIQFGKDVVAPFMDPVGTAENIKNLGHGTLQKMGVMGGEENIKYPDAVGQFFAERYGGMDNLKKTMAEDPVGFLGDLSLVLTGGGALAAKAPGLAGKVGSATKTVGSAIDPINVGVGAVKGAGHLAGAGAAETVGGLFTHTGSEPIKEAYRAGREGGARNQTFLDNMRSKVPAEDTVEMAQDAMSKLRQDRGTEYQRLLSQFQQNQTILNFNEVDRALVDAWNATEYKGVVRDPQAAEIVRTLIDRVNEWKTLPARDYHTPEGFDALKQSIQHVLDDAAATNPRAIKYANKVYNAVRDTIAAQDPVYTTMMKGYEEASHHLRQLEKTLSLPPDRKRGATIDTTLRKLQSTLRNNVNTSFGHRKTLMDYLMENGNGKRVLSALAGQAMQPAFARGLGKLGAQMAAHAAAGTVGAVGLGTAMGALAPLAGSLLLTSPRLVGETANKMGAAAKYSGKVDKVAKPTSRAGYQIGRLTREQEERARRSALRYSGQ